MPLPLVVGLKVSVPGPSGDEFAEGLAREQELLWGLRGELYEEVPVRVWC